MIFTKQFSKILCMLLVLCFVGTALVACGEDGETSSQASLSDAQGTTSQSTEENKTFRLEKQDFGGVTIKVLTDQANDYLACEFAPTAINSDPVNDAAFNRALLIEQEYGIRIEQVYAEHQSGVRDTAREMITSNIDEYQIYAAGMIYLSSLATEGLFVDLANIQQNDYIDLSQPYWDQSVIEDLSVKGSLYFATGDAVVTDDEATWAIFFNKDLADNNAITASYGVDSLYELVENGDWTLDAMYEMAQLVAADTNDGKMEFSASTEDIWGMVAQTYDSYVFTVGAGESLTALENGVPVITVGKESNINAFAKVFDILNDGATVAIAELDKGGSTTYYEDMITIFANGKALFMPNKVQTVQTSTLRNASIRYGILPMPKYSSAQEEYTSTVTVYWCTAMAIPVTNVEKFDATCYAMEALAYYGQENLTPEYYDRTLKNKRFEDTESEDMLDLIFRNRTYDVGAVYSFGDILGFYTGILMSESNTHVSSYDSKKTSWEIEIDNFLALLEEE